MGLVYRVRTAAESVHRSFVLRRALKKFQKNFSAFTDAEEPGLADLVYGWGNESWSARPEYLAACVDHVLKSRGPILECGSGLSTILAGIVAEHRGRPLWSLESMPAWASRVEKCLGDYGVDSVRVCVAPLRDYGDYCWYEPPLSEMPAEFSLVICDGPPADVKGGRYGLLPVMGDRLPTGSVVLLDDAARDQEMSIAKRWRAELGAELHLRGSEKPYLEIEVNRSLSG